MVNRLLRSTLSLLRVMERVSCGIAMEIRITMMVTTTISSTNVKPRRRPILPFRTSLPFCIRCSISGLGLRFSENVKYALAAPALGLRIVLRAAHPPLVLAGERVLGNRPEEFQLGA